MIFSKIFRHGILTRILLITVIFIIASVPEQYPVFAAPPSFTYETLENGREPSLALGIGNTLHIVYCFLVNPNTPNSSYYQIRYAERIENNASSTPTWQTSTVETLAIYTSCNKPSIQIDKQGTVHLVYLVKASTTSQIKYAFKPRTSSDWTLQGIVSGGSSEFGAFSLALTPIGQPRIAYYGAINKDLKYASLTGNEWEIQTLDQDGDVGDFPSMAISQSGVEHIIYTDRLIKPNFKHAWWDADGWHIESYDPDGVSTQGGGGASVAVLADESLHVGYVLPILCGSNLCVSIRYAKKIGNTWVDEEITSYINFSGSISSFAFAVSPDGIPSVGYLYWNGSPYGESALYLWSKQNTSTWTSQLLLQNYHMSALVINELGTHATLFQCSYQYCWMRYAFQPRTYSITGKVTDRAGQAVQGVTISSQTYTAIPDADGNYRLSGLTPGNYTITPSKTGYSFSPSTRQVTITNADLIAQNFEGQNLKTIPIILLPGIMGSRLRNNPKTDFACLLHYKGEVWLKDIATFLIHGGELTLKPDSPASANDCDQIYPEGIFDSGDNDVYSAFISSMNNDGYTVHSFSYDWRLSLEDSANQLDTFINGLNVPKVVLVGHSMGGLVAHTYIANPTRAAKVDKVISVGSPYWGSPKLALSMRSGLPPKEIRIPQTDYYLALPAVADIIRNSPGAMVLLPSEAYLASADGNYYYKNNDQALNTFDAIKDFFVSNSGKRGKQNASLIDQSRAYHTAMDDFASGLNSVDYYIIAANYINTTKSVIREYPCTFLLLPDTCYEIIGYTSGDDTVPYKSASLHEKAGNAKIITLSSGTKENGHGVLMQYSVVINKIKAILSGNPYQTTTASALAATPAPLIQVSVWGDAKVSVKDNANQFLGLDTAGYMVNEIPGAAADFNENWTEIVLPSGQAYTVKFEQKSTIPLKLKITDLRAPSADADFTPNQRAVFVDIPSQPGGVAILPVDLSAGLDSLRLSNDTNNDGTPEQIQPPTSVLNAQQTQDTTMPVTAIDIQGVHNSAGVYRGPVTITLSATDTGLGVHETKYSLDNGKTWQIYSTPITFDAFTTSMFYAYSVDLAGNSEYPFKTQLLGYRTFLPVTTR